MSAYIQKLQADNLRQQHAEQAQQAAQAEAAILTNTHLTPLVDRLRTFIAALPPEVQHKPQPLEFFRRALRGRQGRAAQAGETGEALRTLGFVRKRGWHELDGGFRAVWMPPAERKI